MAMKISLVMAVYNGERYLVEQLDSLRKQTKTIDEVIIVDDCSTDMSRDIINKYLHKYNLTNWKYILNSTTLGYKKNFRKGICIASGDIIFLCDQDDVWHLDKVEVMCGIMTDTKILTLASSFNFINANGDKFDIKQEKGKSNNNLLQIDVKSDITKIDLKVLLKTNFSQGCTMALKKQIKNEFLEYSNSKHPHDWEINLLSAVHHGCYFLNKKLVDYRIHDRNTIGLDDVISTNFLGDKSKRINKRIDLTIGEKEIVEFVLRTNMLNREDKILCDNYLNYLKTRINYLENKDLKKILIYFFKGGYRKFGHFKTIVGDCIAILL